MTDKYWYKNAVIYELYVKGYQDSNSDGKGDFSGLITRLDYLKELGIDCIWLLPQYPTPARDDGYDIMDYFGINPEYGSIENFREFIHESHQRGIRVIADLVLNHTSDQHPWFQSALAGPSSPYFDYYVWSETPDRYSDVRVIFVDSEPSNWTYVRDIGMYYWHRFFHHQPDLNYDNPEVRARMIEVVGYWLDLGLDGFRVDAAAYLFEREGTACENLPETHLFFKELRSMMDSRYPGSILLAEVNQWPEDLAEYFGNGDEFHMAFNFPLMPRLFMAVKREDCRPVKEIMKMLPTIPESCQWAMFLRNHDELTLEMCTDEERDYMYWAYSQDRQMILNKGIRRRLAPLMENDTRKIELLHAILFTLPGSPVIYYGDEIGMGDNVYLGDRNGVRTPMQWNDNKNAGFSGSKPSQLYAPVIVDPEYNYSAVNVESQKNNPNSLLNRIKRFIRIRRSCGVFGLGTQEFLECGNPSLLAYTISYGGDTYLCAFNLSARSQCFHLDLSMYEGRVPLEVIGDTPFPVVTRSPYTLTPNPYGYFIFFLRKSQRRGDKPGGL